MKIPFIILRWTLALWCLCPLLEASAQAPQKINYQAVCRDGSGNIIASQSVNLRITIKNLSPGGLSLYQETHTTFTSSLGLVNLALGGGAVQSGNFSTIPWGTGDKYVQIEADYGSGYMTIGTPQLLSVPYALYAGQSGTSCLSLQQAYDGCLGSGSGRLINIFSNSTPVEINSSQAASIALKSTHSQNGVAVSAISSYSSTQYPSIQATTASNYGTIGGATPPTAAILGNSSAKAYGVAGQVEASASGEAAVYGSNLRTAGGMGVRGQGFNGTVGQTIYATGYGVSGWNTATGVTPGIGTLGQGITGVAGQSTNLSLSYGLYSYDDCGITGSLDVGVSVNAIVKSFVIDHPIDSEHKLLKHFCIESPELLNLYRGIATIDAHGEAIVELPAYFTLINKNFSYQLTAIGVPAPGIYIKEKLENNHFTIAGGTPGAEISWTVCAERNDIYIQKHPEIREVEPLKTGRYAGKYVFPEGFGVKKEKSLLYLPQPVLSGSDNKAGSAQPELKLLKP